MIDSVCSCQLIPGTRVWPCDTLPGLALGHLACTTSGLARSDSSAVLVVAGVVPGQKVHLSPD